MIPINQRNQADTIQSIIEGNTSLGIEFGSTRIKAVLIGPNHVPLASGSHRWENQLADGIWTYSMEDVWIGVADAYANLATKVRETYGQELRHIGALGVSAMMHGYLPFDRDGKQLVNFRTWRNTITEQAAFQLTQAFSFNIPQRWSIAHLYQAILNGEDHVGKVAHLTTLAGYVHWKLSGKQVLGVGEACGMFPIDSATGSYHPQMVEIFNQLATKHNMPWKLLDILPSSLPAGADAGTLTPEGAALLDPTGTLQPGSQMCPPEGDAGTGMVATNSIAPHTGNVSAGTSIFAMVVLEKALSKIHTEIDMVATPSGMPVAMVHCNNCTSDLDAWVRLFSQMQEAIGAPADLNAIYHTLYTSALQGAPDGGGLVNYNYYSGEPVIELEDGRPLFARLPDSTFNLPNFARTLLYSTIATLKLGMDILTIQENVSIEKLMGHGGLFTVKGVGQQLMAGALNVKMEVLEGGDEGGAWGIALLAAYTLNHEKDESLADFLNQRVFADMQGSCVSPLPEDVDGFVRYMERYTACMPVQKAAAKCLR